MYVLHFFLSLIYVYLWGHWHWCSMPRSTKLLAIAKMATLYMDRKLLKENIRAKVILAHNWEGFLLKAGRVIRRHLGDGGAWGMLFDSEYQGCSDTKEPWLIRFLAENWTTQEHRSRPTWKVQSRVWSRRESLSLNYRETVTIFNIKTLNHVDK